MQHIEKQHPLAAFDEFLRKEKPTRWDDIHKTQQAKDVYTACRNAILYNEQKGLGGYTEKPLLNAKDIHIDHYKKKGMGWQPDVTFDWNNLIVEDRNPQYGACYKDKLTSSKDDYDKMINPVTEYPERYFDYLTNGEIKPKDDITDEEREKAEFTINRFNLNHTHLQKTREAIIKNIAVYIKQLDDETIKAAMEDNGFPTVVAWSLKQLR